MPETLDEVIVDHPHRLHEGVADGAADEAEASPLQVFAHGVRFGRVGRHLGQRLPSILLRPVTDEAPDVLVECPKLLLDRQKRLGVVDRRLDLQPIANNAGVQQQALLLSLAVLGDDGRIEVVEGFPVVLSLFENRLPTQTRLRPFKDQKLEQQTVIMDRDTPLLVVVFDVLLGLCPREAA